MILIPKPKLTSRCMGLISPMVPLVGFPMAEIYFADVIGQLLGFPKLIPPYATATNQEISTGVNYGSGAAGIREESGSHPGDRISFGQQLFNHAAIVSRLSLLQCNRTFTNEYLKKCI